MERRQATEQRHGLPHFSPALPPRPLQPRAGDARASVEKYPCTHKDSHQQRHVPPRSFPGEGWASGIPVVTTHSGRCPLANGTQAPAGSAGVVVALRTRGLPTVDLKEAPGRATPRGSSVPAVRHKGSRSSPTPPPGPPACDTPLTLGEPLDRHSFPDSTPRRRPGCREQDFGVPVA